MLTDLPEVNLSPDPNANMILATALEGRADYLVFGGEKYLLALGSIESIPIITARQAVEYPEIVVGTGSG